MTVPGSDFIFKKRKTSITPRHLLTRTSRLVYWFTHDLLRLRSEARKQEKPSFHVTERYEMQLVFKPGTSWLYGCSLDRAGMVVSRPHGRMQLENYVVETQCTFPKIQHYDSS